MPSAVFASQPLECPALGNQKGKKSSWPAAWSIPLHLVHLQLLGSEALKYLQAAQWPGWSLPAPPAPPIALNPKGQKSTQLCLGWRENLGRWGPALGHLLQLNNSSKSCVNSICWAQTPSVELSLAGLGRNLIFFLSEKLLKLSYRHVQLRKENPATKPSCVSHSDTSWSVGAPWKWWTRVGFDATSKPFWFQLKFLESGSPQLGETLHF